MDPGQSLLHSAGGKERAAAISVPVAQKWSCNQLGKEKEGECAERITEFMLPLPVLPDTPRTPLPSWQYSGNLVKVAWVPPAEVLGRLLQKPGYIIGQHYGEGKEGSANVAIT